MEAESLQVLRSQGQVGIFYRGTCYAIFSEDDKFSRNYFLVQLHESGGVKLKDLAEQFEIGYQQCSNIVVAFREKGLAGIQDQMGNAVGNRRIITDKIGKFILELKGQGKTYSEISQSIRFRFKKKIKSESLKAWVYLKNKNEVKVTGPEQEEIPMGEVLPAVREVELVKVGRLESAEWKWNSYAGAMVLYSMIAKSGVLEVFANLRDEETAGTAWDVKRVVLTLLFLHALRCKSVEQGKHLLLEDFGAVVGGDFLRLQWLRYAVDRIVEKENFPAVMEAYCKQVVKHTENGSKVFYTDGHFSTYYGKRSIPKGFDPRRQMPMRGRNTIYLHNSQGENVYLFESPTNASLSSDIETLVAGMEKLAIELKGKTLFFDRGGWSARCFRFLRLKSLYFGSYLKYREKERLIDPKLFTSSEVVADDGEIVRYELFEKEVRETRYGKVRTIVLLDEGKQIPIICTNPDLSAAEVVYRLSRRWREENCFKYMIEHFGIDLLTTYKTEAAPDKVVARAHPQRKQVNQLIKQKQGELRKLRAELAEKIQKTGEGSTKTVQEFFSGESELNLAIKNAQVDLDILQRERSATPTKEKRNLKDDHVIIRQKRRLFMNAMKALNYNSE
ncbi:MAG: putative transposase, partial [Deltaproteobacteria bacterium]